MKDKWYLLLMDEKIKSISVKLKRFFNNSEIRPTEVYDKLRKIANTQKQYFELFTPESFLKLVIYEYSLVRTGDFAYGDSILKNLLFVDFFVTDLVDHREECGYCDGSGRVSCDYCDGDGYRTCNDCDGNGTIPCVDCEGSGNVENDEGESQTCDYCDGSGEVSCDTCDGDGRFSCNECSGESSVECNECYGDGEIEDGSIDYDHFFICTWDKEFKDLVEIRVKTDESIPINYYYDRYGMNSIILNQKTDNTFLKSFIDSDEMYILDATNDPKLKLDNQFKIVSLDAEAGKNMASIFQF